MNYQIFMAFKHLVKGKRKGFVSLISVISISGISLGVMALIVVMAVMSGFDQELKSKIVGMNPHIIIQKPGGVENPEALCALVRKLDPQLENVAPYMQGQVIIRSSTNATGAVIRGEEPAGDQLDFAKNYMIVGDIELRDRTVKAKPVGTVAIGSSLAHMLRVGINDPVIVISPQVTEDKGMNLKGAKAEEFIVGGIFEMGMNDFDTTFVIMDIKHAQELFNMPGRVSGLSLKLQEVDRADELKLLVESSLGMPYVVKSWQDMNRSFFSALKVEKSVMRILLTLIIMVAAFNIISTLIMVVMEKTKEIGILRALGATRAGIKSIFLIEGFTIGAFGTAVGGAAGYFIAKHINGVASIVERFTGFEVFPKDIYYFNQIPAKIIPSDIVTVIVIALLLSLLAGLYPAHQAGRVSPVEAIRYE